MLQRRRGEARGQAWLCAVIPAIIMALVTCSGDDSRSTADAGSSTTPGVVDKAECPTDTPAANADCVLPEGTTCAFGACKTSIARCANGRWRFGASPPARAACPARFPTSGDSCPDCFSPEVECILGSNECAVSANRSVAKCKAGVWDITTTPCTIPIPDAGADVQGDAGPDSD